MKRSGFTLLECIISLLVVSMITVLIQLALPAVNQLQTASLKDTTDWYLFLERLEDDQKNFSLVDVQKSYLVLSSTTSSDQYIVQGGRQAIYLRTNHGGYLPILVNYQPRSLSFCKFDSSNVLVNCCLESGERKSAILHFKTPG